MKAFPASISALQILVLMLYCTIIVDANATSCRLRATFDETSQYFDLKKAQAELENDLSGIPLVAIAQIETLSNKSYRDFSNTSEQIGLVKIKKFYRQPLQNNNGKLDPNRAFHVALAPGKFKAGDKILFFAYPETDQEFQSRTEPDKNLLLMEDSYPSSLKKRLWRTAIGSCYSAAYPLDSKLAKFLQREIANIEKRSKQPGVLNFRVFEQGLSAQSKPKGMLKIIIQSLDAKLKRYTFELDTSKDGHLQLMPGRYHIEWPVPSGISLQCYTSFVPNNCYVDIHGGLATNAHAVFTGNAKLDLMLVDDSNVPVNFFGELALVPLLIDSSYPSAPVAIAPLRDNKTIPDQDDYNGNFWLREGRYELRLFVRHYDPKKPYDCTPDVEKNYPLPLKFSGENTEWASQITIPPGKSLLLAKIPKEIALIKVDMIKAISKDLKGTIAAHCSDFYNGQWIEELTPRTQVLVPMGMKVSISRVCNQCTAPYILPLVLDISKDLQISVGDTIKTL
jgi:hypothetical protein